MILGIGIVWLLSGSFQMDNISVYLTGPLPTIAFISLAIASFAKAGAMPMHTWIPDCAEKAPIPVTAFLPASLDKLLGIYLLGRIAMDLFVMNRMMGQLLLVVGAVTIIAAVMMALVQHDLKKLLSYHAVSQVGYMVLGIGTGNPIGIAGGIFHMLNHAIYKGCLFLTGGAVEHRTHTTDLDKLGGLAKLMPITFITCLIAALSISGVPPFNGFVSKWMVYQGVIQLGKDGDKLWIIWLVAAMFGSALTLASFMKLIHSVFLGSPSPTTPRPIAKRNEVSFAMWMPMAILAGLCVIFGVFAYRVPLKNFIFSAVPGISFLGFWSPGLATLLIIIGIILGVIIYWLSNIRGLRTDTAYVGGEIIPQDSRVTGVDFYDTIKDLGTLKVIYREAEKKLFDIYDQGTKFVFFFIRGLRKIHSGILPTYLFWSLFGMLILFIIMMFRI
jgi:formate hydrogenlyase subunit 3/multisubunit Na+/H+ antiporter MnhD subunit